MKEVKNYIEKNKKRFIEELIELLKIPSISADSDYRDDVFKCADLVAHFIKEAGGENVQICKPLDIQ